MNTATLLESLQSDLSTLKTNVAAKGVEVTESDNFTTLAAKVANIPSGGATDIYKVASIAERDALTGVNEGDICVVYASSIVNWQKDTQASSIIFPETVMLPSAYEGDYWGRLENADESSSSYFDGNIQLMQQEFRLDGYSDAFDLRVSYSSEDGITFVRQEFRAEDMGTGESYIDGNTVNLPITVKLRSEGSEYDKALGYFMQTGSMTFDGIFSYKDGSWGYTNIGLNENGSNYLTGYKGYTNSGLITGTFPQGTKRDLNFIVNNRVGSFKVDDCSYLFSDVHLKLTELGFSLDTSDCTNMESMFKECSKLINLDLSNLNTTNVVKTEDMFTYCTGLETINFSNRNFANLKTCRTMFYHCLNLVSVDFSGVLPANKIKEANHMFYDCSSLKTIDLSFIHNLMGDYENPNQNEIYLYNMFSNCSALESVDLRNMNFDYAYTQNSRVTTSSMFSSCTSLKKIDMRSFTFDKVHTHTNMFGTTASNGVPNNCLIIVKDATQKSWINTNYSRLTNVQTVAEYEASQGA